MKEKIKRYKLKYTSSSLSKNTINLRRNAISL